MAGEERGDVVLSGLLRTVLALLVVGLVLFEIGAVLVNRVQLDEAARVAAQAGAQGLAERGSQRVAEAAVQARLGEERDVALDAVVVDAPRVTVTVSRPAPVLLLDRMGPLARYAVGRATVSAGA